MGVLVHPNAPDHLCPYKIVQPSIIQDNFFFFKKKRLNNTIVINKVEDFFTRHDSIIILIVVLPSKALMPIMLVQEYKDKTIIHMVHEVLMWFGQPCLRPRMRENDFTIQYRILQRT